MAAAIKEEDLKEFPVIWNDPDGKYKLIKRDELNMEIIQFMRLGESGRGRQGEVRDAWCSVPMYYSNLEHAFNKMIELKTVAKMTTGISELKSLVESLREFKEDFQIQCKRNLKNVIS
jgi:hypothetical protein